MIQFFHWYSEGDGKLWKEAEKQANYLSDLGIELHQFGFLQHIKEQMAATRSVMMHMIYLT